MLKLTVSEKGGEDKTYVFEETVVSLGRVQGNTLVLAKPNISKRHASFTVKDQKVFVNDLNSTNGTYVNGRRIFGPREIGPEDRVYIGDYVIRAVVAGLEPSAPLPVPPPEDVQRRATVAISAMKDVPTAGASDQRGMPELPPSDELSGEVPLDIEVELEVPEAPPPVQVAPAAPAPAPVPAAVAAWKEVAAETASPLPEAPAPSDGLEKPQAGVRADFSPARSRGSGLIRRGGVADLQSDSYMETLRVVAERAAKEVFSGIPPERAAFDDDEWAALSSQVMTVVEQLRREDAIPANVDPFAVTQDILFDFAGLGPLEELLGEEAVRGVFVDSVDRVFVTRGAHTERVSRGFASGSTLERVTIKLCDLAGLKWAEAGPRLEGRLPDGTYLLVLRPPLTYGGPVLVIERLSGGTLTLEDMQAAGLIDDRAAMALRAAVRDHRNIVVCGPARSGKTMVLNALLRLLPAADRVILLEPRRELALTQPDVVALSKEAVLEAGGAGLISRLKADAVVLSDMTGMDAQLAMRLAMCGQQGIMATMVADSVGQCVKRLELMTMLEDRSIGADAVREGVQGWLDVVVVLGRRSDGRAAVIEVASPSGVPLGQG